MLRSTSLFCASLSLAVLGGAIAAGCSSSTDEPAATAGTPPSRPVDAPEGDGNGYVFAVEKLFLGETDRHGIESASAWKKFGYNLDGKKSTADSTDLCKPLGNAPAATVYPDGNDGIDNSFGKLLIPTIHALSPFPTTGVNTSIAEGSFTLMVKIDKLGKSANYSNLAAALYGGADLGMPPAWDGNDEWPVLPELLKDPNDINSSLVPFKSSYVAEQTWVSGNPATLSLTIGISGNPFTLTISNAVITMELDPDRAGAANGIIAGVLEVEPLISQLREVAGSISPDLCNDSSTFDSFADQIRQNADIMADGSQDPSKSCEAISIGIGFEAKAVKLGPIAAKAEPGPDPCAGGMGGAGGAAGGAGGAGGN